MSPIPTVLFFLVGGIFTNFNRKARLFCYIWISGHFGYIWLQWENWHCWDSTLSYNTVNKLDSEKHWDCWLIHCWEQFVVPSTEQCNALSLVMTTRSESWQSITNHLSCVSGMDISPMCDRHNANVEKSQVWWSSRIPEEVAFEKNYECRNSFQTFEVGNCWNLDWPKCSFCGTFTNGKNDFLMHSESMTVLYTMEIQPSMLCKIQPSLFYFSGGTQYKSGRAAVYSDHIAMRQKRLKRLICLYLFKF